MSTDGDIEMAPIADEDVPHAWREAYACAGPDAARRAYEASLQTEARTAEFAEAERPDLPRRQSRFARSNFDHPMRP